MSKKKVHIIGTHGVPAKYGGFETLADFLCQHLASDFDITVYCSSKKYDEKPKDYHGAKLRYVNLSASGVSGIIYDVITFIPALFRADVILYLSPVGSGFMTILGRFFKTKVIVNHGGLNEWEREKLSWFQKKWAKFNHSVAAKTSDVNIADNLLYQASLKSNFNSDSVVISYGGDHAQKIDKEVFIEKYPFANERYAVSVSRAQIDNNIHLVLEAFVGFNDFKLVLISNWEVSSYGIELKEKYKNYPNIILLDAIYDKTELDYLRSNSYVYIHSHSRCGIAPSLVEAMSLNKPVISFDVGTNRETTNNLALFFSNSKELETLLNSLNQDVLDLNAKQLHAIAKEKYTWEIISNQYRQLFLD